MIESSRLTPWLSVLTLACAQACSSPTSQNDAAADVNSDASDVLANDATSSDATDVVPPSDVTWPACSVPAPMIGGTTATDALAMAPARCGQPAHHWLTDATLGTVVAMGAHATFSPGTIRALAAGAMTTLPVAPVHDTTLDQIDYVTQDRGQLVHATALVVYPSDITSATALDTVLFLHGTSGFTDACAPSNDTSNRVLMAYLASLGYIVVAPDYIGMRGFGAATGFPHPYLVGQPTAIASLDAVRAGMRHVASLHGPLCASNHYIPFGVSQGGHASLWVERLAPYYAPELTPVGAVASVPPAELTDLLRNYMTAPTVSEGTYLSAFSMAVTPDWYGLTPRLGEVLASPYNTQLPMRLASTCDLSTVATVTAPTDFFTAPLITAAASAGSLRSYDPWGCLLAENSLTTTSISRIAPTTPGYGVLFILGSADTLVLPTIERPAFTTLCSQGMQMQFLECMGSDHVATTYYALPEILDFIHARFAGTPMDPADLCVLHDPVHCRGTP